jgi:hypothetical protein
MRKFIVVLILTLCPAISSATIMRALSLEQMTKDADSIVYGEVVKQVADWNAEKTRIYTMTTVRVTEEWKGEAKTDSLIVIRQIGGSVGALTQSVAGNAQLSTGETVIVFLERSPREAVHFIIGMTQGKFGVKTVGTSRLVQPGPMSGVKLLTPQPGQESLTVDHQQTPAAAQGTHLVEFRAKVRRALAR